MLFCYAIYMLCKLVQFMRITKGIPGANHPVAGQFFLNFALHNIAILAQFQLPFAWF